MSVPKISLYGVSLSANVFPVAWALVEKELPFDLIKVNLFAGEHNFHSRLEWVSAQDMEKAVEVIVHLCQVWDERTVG